MFTCGPALLGGNNGDPYFSSVISLLHFDGLNGSTTIVDQIIGNTWTCHGATALGTGQIKFGSASLDFPSNSTGNNLKGPSSLSPFAGDFTVEFFAFPINNSTSFGAAALFSVDTTSGPRGFQITWAAANNVSVAVVGAVTTITSSNTLNLNAWNYIAVSVSGTTAYLFVNGVMTTGTWVVGAGNPAVPLTFGTHVDGITDFKGYIDEFRLTKGIARYTSPFTPPTQPFPNY